MRDFTIACRPSSYGDFEPIAFEHLASLGVRNVEIYVPAADKLEATRDALRSHGLAATTMHGEIDLSRRDVGRMIADQMPAFAALGTHIMFLCIKSDGIPLDTIYGRLRDAGDAAASAAVTIALETHPDLITNAETTLRTMKGVNHPNVRVNFDTANIYFYNRDIDGVAELRTIAPWVAAVHLKETDGGYRHWHFPALGRGIVNFRETFDVLDAAGFDGPCTLEVEGIEGETATERLVCSRIAESVGYLRGLGRF